MATAQSPTCTASELPIVTGTSEPLGSILITAKSVSESKPTTLARYSPVSPLWSFTLMWSTLAIT